MTRTLTLLGCAIGVIVTGAACSKLATTPTTSVTPPLGAGQVSTSRGDLARTIATTRERLAKTSDDAPAAVMLADALLRETRVSGNAGLAKEAERVLLDVLKRDSDRYDARRMLAATYLSQHRFADALREAERCRATRADDPWVWGVIGDAHIERGEYDAAFAAFDRMAALKPTAAAYARVSYAREVQGDLPGALRTMRMAAEATSAHDPESLAWHHAQVGQLYLQMGRLADARREFLAATHAFPEHPFAQAGLARVAEASGDVRTALDIVMAMLETSPTPADLAYSGDLMAKLGEPEAAERQYRLAEASWRTDAPEPSRLARFLAEHGRHLDEAIVLGEQARIDRDDIFTADALAWAYFQTGQIDKAKSMMALALRTGTRDRTIRVHADTIERASQGSVRLPWAPKREAQRRQPHQGRQARQ